MFKQALTHGLNESDVYFMLGMSYYQLESANEVLDTCQEVFDYEDFNKRPLWFNDYDGISKKSRGRSGFT